MSTIVRSVHNNLTVDVALTHTNIVIPASSTVDLYTIVSDDELLQIQEELAQMVTNGTLTVVISDDKSEILAGGFAIPQYSVAPTGVEGQLIYNTTLHKLQIHTAATWETVTSA